MRATLLVHPGYLRGENWECTVVREDHGNGSYDEYLKNLKMLYSSQTTPSIFIVHKEAATLSSWISGFEPTKDSVILEWSGQYHNGERIALLDSSFKRVKSFPSNDLSSFLSEQDITECSLSGEVGPHAGHYQGCVGKIYSYLKDAMEVKGVENCVFPLIPDLTRLEDEFWRRFSKVMKMDAAILYAEQKNMLQQLYPMYLFPEDQYNDLQASK